MKFKPTEEKDAYSCPKCGALKTRSIPGGMFIFLIADDYVNNWKTCDRCQSEMVLVEGTWEKCEVKKGIWPFRKVKEVHWRFTEQ